MIESCTIRPVRVPQRDSDGNPTGLFYHYTDVLITADGQSYYSRCEGTTNEGYQRAQFEQRRRPGFYRKEG